MSFIKSKDDPGCQHLGCDPEKPCAYSQTEAPVVFIATVRERKVVDLSVTPTKRKWVITERFEGTKKEVMEQVFSSLSDLNFSVTIMRKR